jgi:GNAT superfamily N-acetyltransferase
MTGPDFRTATLHDVDALQALQWRSLRRGLGGARPAALEAMLWRLSGLAPRHVVAGDCLVAEADRGVLGFVVWQGEALDHHGLSRERLPALPARCGRAATLRALHVAPEAEGRGIGAALLRAAEAQLAAAQFQAAEAFVPPSAEAFFRRHGYVALSAHAARLPAGALLELQRMIRTLDGKALRHPAAAEGRDRTAAARG